MTDTNPADNTQPSKATDFVGVISLGGAREDGTIPDTTTTTAAARLGSQTAPAEQQMH